MRLRIVTPSRLHFGLIDLNGSSGRIDGGMGVALEKPGWEIEASESSEFHVEGEGQILGRELLTHLCENIQNLQVPVNILIRESLPQHIGLGSKTQLALAIATGVLRINGYQKDLRTLANIMGRGGTSGIGVSAFDKGGCILDAGHSFGPNGEKNSFLPSSASNAKPPPVVMQSLVPKDWKFIIGLPSVKQGASGLSEVEIFRENCPISKEDTNEISHTILMKMVPALLESDIHKFGEGLLNLTQLGFKRLEIHLQHPIIRELIEISLACGCVGANMSSFGPVTFALTDSTEIAKETSQKWDTHLKRTVGGKIWITSANNTGAMIQEEE